MNIVQNKTFSEERALYGISFTNVINCRFEGEEDGESAFKETHDLQVSDSYFALRYPFWHTKNAVLNQIEMTDTCRAALWYDSNVSIKNSKLMGIKAIRECENTQLIDCVVNSPEFGWMSDIITIQDSNINSEYAFLNSKNITLKNVEFSGKYSFQYVQDSVIRNSYLDTKDAFWHSRNITVYDSVIKGEYLGWYSNNLKFVNCKIIGTQPLCYAKGLVLENCEMIDTDLAFEYSDVRADLIGSIDSIKNPLSGEISVDHVNELILDDSLLDHLNCRIITRKP